MKSKLLPLNILHILNDGFLVSFSLLLPFIAKDLGLNLTQVGFLGSSLNITIMLLAIPSAYIASKLGGFKSLLLAILFYSLGLVITSFSPTFYTLAFAFTFAGLGFGVFHPIAFSLIAKFSTKENRGANVGSFTAIGDIGRILISSGITFLAVYIGWRNSSLTCAAIGFLAFILVFSLTLKNKTTITIEEKPKTELKWIEIIKNRKYVISLLSGTLDSFASTSLFIFLPFLLLYRGVDAKEIGPFTAVFFIGNLIGKAGMGQLVDKIGSKKVFITAEIFMAIFIFLLANSSAFILIIAFSIVLGALTKGTLPVYQTFITESVEHHGNYEKAFAIAGLVVTTASTVAPTVLGFISDRFGIVNAFNLMAVFAILAIIPLLVLKLIEEKKFV